MGRQSTVIEANGESFRICSLCNTKKKADEFRRYNSCKDCCRERDKKYGKKRYKKDKEKVIERNKEWRANNAEKVRETNRQYNLNNRVKLYKQAKECRIKKIDQYRKVARERAQEKRETSLEFRLTEILRKRLRNALINGCKGKKTDSALNLLGCSVEELKKHLELKFVEGMNWENYGKFGWHIDHIIPCAKFDLTKAEEQKKCFHYTNMQPLWATENLSKGSKVLN